MIAIKELSKIGLFMLMGYVYGLALRQFGVYVIGGGAGHGHIVEALLFTGPYGSAPYVWCLAFAYLGMYHKSRHPLLISTIGVINLMILIIVLKHCVAISEAIRARVIFISDMLTITTGISLVMILCVKVAINGKRISLANL